MRVQRRTEGPVVRIRLSRDASGEALLDPEAVAALHDAFDSVEAAAEVRVIVVEGEPGSFCRGLDIGRVARSGAADVGGAVRRFADWLARVRDSKHIVLAAVDGPAAGGGIAVAAAADLTLASSRATFALPELPLGILPAVVLPVLHERMRPHHARRLALGGPIDAAEALRLGLIDRLADPPEALEAMLREALKHLLRCHPGAAAELKRLGRRMAALDPAEALRVGAERSAEILADPETRRGLLAFLDGDRPPWFERYRPEGGAR